MKTLKNHYIFNNLYTILTTKSGFISFLLSFLLIGRIGRGFIDLELTLGNMGAYFAYSEVVLFWLFVLLFSLFIAASVYKIQYLKKIETKKAGVGSVGGVLGMIAAGCSACSITLASYIGLASLINLLPYNGLELNILAIGLIVYALHDTLKKLHTCSIKK